jgi:hypothetical protein
MTQRQVKIAWKCPWHKNKEIRRDDCLLSTEIPLAEADALLCDWKPVDELLKFPRAKAWYCCEPMTRRDFFREQGWEEYLRRLSTEEFLNHWNPDPNFRVPHITHFGHMECSFNPDRLNKVIAVVSNTGPSRLRKSRSMSLRLQFCAQDCVDLYGRKSGWERYRRNFWSPAGLPGNYKGELPGDWGHKEKRSTLEKYKAAICLENSDEPHYFTEKFVGAVEAGCIPVYHAHETVRDGILRGAKWVDPSTFGCHAKETLEFALQEPIEVYQETNSRWLKSDAAKATHYNNVYDRIMSVLVRKAR